MKDNKVEEKLKCTAKQINPGEFSEVWLEAKQKIDEKQMDKQAQVIPELVPVASMIGTNNSSNLRIGRKKWLLVVCATIVLLGITLSLVLGVLRPEKRTYFSMSDLYVREVTEEQFYEGLNTAGMVISDLSDYDIQLYDLYYIEGDIVKGGMVDIVSDDYLLTIHYYASDVDVDILFDKGYKEYVGIVNIKYFTEYADEVYNTIGQTQYNDLTCILEYMSLNDDATKIFGELFN